MNTKSEQLGYLLLYVVLALFIYGIARSVFYAVKSKRKVHLAMVASSLISGAVFYAVAMLHAAEKDSSTGIIALSLFLICSTIIFISGCSCERACKASLKK